MEKNILKLENVMSSGQRFYQAGRFAEAQKEFSDAKIMATNLIYKATEQAHKAALREVVHKANRVLAITPVSRGLQIYYASTTGYNPETGILADDKRALLEAVVEIFRIAESAFVKFESSFRSYDERMARLQWLSKMYPLFADACHKLAVDSHNRGGKAISEAVSASINSPALREGLKIWEQAMIFYAGSFGVVLRAGNCGIAVDNAYANSAVRAMAELNSASIQWANVLGDSGLESHYRSMLKVTSRGLGC